VGFNPLVSTQIMFNQIPPAGAGGSFNPSLPETGKISRNPTTGRWWMVQSLPLFYVVERVGGG